jgi:hypothetical protein
MHGNIMAKSEFNEYAERGDTKALNGSQFRRNGIEYINME